MASPYIDLSSPIQILECKRAWDNLTLKEKLYAYYFSKASWEGSLICFFQNSYEAPGLFLLFQDIFSIPDLKSRALSSGLSEEEWNRFLAYAAGVYTNTGNYRSFGATKFIPEIPKDRFELVLSASGSALASEIWAKIGDLTYDYSSSRQVLNFPDKGGVTAYYSSNVTSSDAELVKRFLISKNLTDVHVNSRLWKVDDNTFEVRIASLKNHYLDYFGDHQFEGKTVRIVGGDFDVFMKRIIDNLTQALPYAANQTQTEMLLHYIQHFITGDIDEHKNSQRSWIKDKGPVIETNIGFIETYVDPLNIRAEFEGFVSMVDKVVSAKFSQLVNNAPAILAHLPWGPVFEKDVFQAPDFTSLDVLTFGSSGVPIGINIPNYDDIRQKDGFKNVNLGNAYPKVKPETLQFLKEEDVRLIVDAHDEAETIAVALHELLGHGSGKLLTHNAATGEYNFDVNAMNPATGEKIDSWYQSDETWSSKFGELSSAYEECRAETVAVYLSCFPEPYQIFGVDDTERARNMLWLYMAYQGVKGLLLYNPEHKIWGQAHCCARYVIFKVMLEAGNNFLSVRFTDDGQFLLEMDYSLIPTVGFEAIKTFLTKLHCYKSTGDAARGKPFFNNYAQVDEVSLRIRQIVVENQKPRRMNLQSNLNLSAHEPQLLSYPETFEGVIASYQDRFPRFDNEMYTYWVNEFSNIIRN